MEACVRFRSSLAVLFGVCSILGAADTRAPHGPRTVAIASGLTEPEFLMLSCAATASDADAVPLIDVPVLRGGLESFLRAYQPGRVLWVGQTTPATDAIRRTWSPEAMTP